MPTAFTPWVDGTTPLNSTNLTARDTELNAIETGAAHYVLTTGGANAYVATPTPAWTAYAAGNWLHFKASFANTAAATIAVSGLAAKSLKKNGVALASADI